MGIKISTRRDKTYEQELREHEQEVIRREVAETVISEQQALENRKNQLIREARKTAERGTMVTVTQEMIDLGIAEQVATMNWEAELNARVKRFFLDHPDDQEDYDYLGADSTIAPDHYLN